MLVSTMFTKTMQVRHLTISLLGKINVCVHKENNNTRSEHIFHSRYERYAQS